MEKSGTTMALKKEVGGARALAHLLHLHKEPTWNHGTETNTTGNQTTQEDCLVASNLSKLFVIPEYKLP